jgi:hypothetical protein
MVNLQSSDEEILAECKSSLKSIKDLTVLLLQKTEKIEKKDQNDTVRALEIIDLLSREIIKRAQPFVMQTLNNCLVASGDKKSTPETRNAAERAVSSIVSHTSPNALREMLPALFKAMDASMRWVFYLLIIAHKSCRFKGYCRIW